MLFRAVFVSFSELVAAFFSALLRSQYHLSHIFTVFLLESDIDSVEWSEPVAWAGQQQKRPSRMLIESNR